MSAKKTANKAMTRRETSMAMPSSARKSKVSISYEQAMRSPFFKVNPETKKVELLPLNLSPSYWENNGRPKSAQKINSKKKQKEESKDNPYFKINPETKEVELLPLNLSPTSCWNNNGRPKSAQKVHSDKKQRGELLKNNPFFKFNPVTNEFDLQPLPFELFQDTNGPKSTDQKKAIRRGPKTVHTRASSGADDIDPKKRKIDHTVRKELFKVPVRKPQWKRSSINKNRNSAQADSPLGYPFKSPKRPILKFNKEPVIPEEDDSKLLTDAEFLELEKLCDASEAEQSPVSSVCEMMECNMMLNSTKKDVKHRLFGKENDNSKETDSDVMSDEAIMEIETILEEDKAKYEMLQEQMRSFDQQHRENISKIQRILDKYKNKVDRSKAEDKENESQSQRRSLRLKNKNEGSDDSDNCSKGLASPVMLKSGDLRKKTLTKSLVDKYQKYQIQSPRIEKALSLYNSMRKDMSILSTPKMNRHLLASTPGSTNSARNLSIRVQKQCLLLQDTPIAK